MKPERSCDWFALAAGALIAVLTMGCSEREIDAQHSEQPLRVNGDSTVDTADAAFPSTLIAAARVGVVVDRFFSAMQFSNAKAP